MLRDFIAEKLRSHLGFDPTDSQVRLIEMLADYLSEAHPGEIMLIKGYAGTGKTTFVNAIVRSLSELKQKSVLLAPTGRAAKVMSAYTGRPAWTIHKTIYRQKAGKDGMGVFVLDRNLYKNTFFIVDESSMIGNRSNESVFGSGDLLRDLFDYIEKGSNCRLILIGDTAQLPPVGLDLSPALDRRNLESMGYRVREIVLTDVIRQSAGSGVLVNATSIRELIARSAVAYPRLSLSGFNDIHVIGGDEVLEQITGSYDRYGTGETIVVTRSNKRANRFNAGIRSQILWREEQITRGDLLMVVKNNYFWKDEENRVDFIANGDIVRINRVKRFEELYGFRFADVELTLMDYGEVEIEAKILLDVIDIEGPALTADRQRELYTNILDDYPDLTNRRKKALYMLQDPYFNALQVKFAYAVTCHKAQGGQWKSVFIDQGYFTEDMLSIDYLRWLYTAFTRATEKLYLVNFASQFLSEW